MTAVLEPLTPTDDELSHMTKPQLTAVIQSYGVRPSSKTDKPGLLKTAKAFVHSARADLQVEVEAAAVRNEGVQPGEPTATDAPGTDLERVESAPTHVVPEYSRFQVIQQVAAVLTKSNLTPDTLRGNLPMVTHVLLKANDIGIPLTTALEQVYVIHGKTGMEAKLMRALIRRDGHVLTQPKCDGYRAIVSGRRADTGEEGEAEFTLDDAIEFDLIAGYTANVDGTYTVKPVMVNGKEPKPQWRKDTRNMLVERATSRLARWLFSECIGGITYTPDELGYIEAEGEEVERPRYGRAGEAEPTMTHKQMLTSLAERIAELPDDVRRELAQRWQASNFPRVDDLRPPQIPTATRWVEEAEAQVAARDDTSTIPDAEQVSEPEAGEPGSSDGQPGDGDLGDVAASPAPAPADELFDPDTGVLTCAGCHEPIPENEPPVWGNDDQPYHQACSPFG